MGASMMKQVKAWAVVNDKGGICRNAVYPANAELRARVHLNVICKGRGRVVRVEIREVEPKRKAKEGA